MEDLIVDGALQSTQKMMMVDREVEGGQAAGRQVGRIPRGPKLKPFFASVANTSKRAAEVAVLDNQFFFFLPTCSGRSRRWGWLMVGCKAWQQRSGVACSICLCAMLEVCLAPSREH